MDLALIHLVFHISSLRKCVGDPTIIVSMNSVGVKDSLNYVKVPIKILDRQSRKLRTKKIVSVKVLWRNEKIGEATWESEEDMNAIYPHLFTSQ